MSAPTVPSPGPGQNGQPAKSPTPAAGVIRRLNGAEETSQERLVQKHLPAWVISGAVHVGVILVAFLLFGGRQTEAKVTEKIITTTVEKEAEEKPIDLTNEDLGLESTLEASFDVDREDQKNVDAKATEDPLGLPDTTMSDPIAYAPPGMAASEMTGGAEGLDGSVMPGGGGAGGLMSAGFVGRSGATKNKLLKEGGGNEKSEAAVARGLAWLARQQRADGSWQYEVGSHKNDTVAATGMALLPFLAAGQTHRTGKYAKNVMGGIVYLIKQMEPSGKFRGSSMYVHGIGTIPLCECYGMTKDRSLLLAPAQRAINYMQAAQGPDGSWGYQAGTNGDTSIVGWQIQALKAAALTKDITVSKVVFDKAVAFLDRVGGGSRKATYGYRDGPGAPATSLTAVGLLCRYYLGWTPQNPGFAEGVQGLFRKEPAKGKPLDMYYYYYATQVVHFYEGKEWHEKWNPKMRDWLVDLQVNKDGPNQGSWDPDNGHIGTGCGRLGTTCLVLLTLEVYYRHLPLYKRDQTGLKELER